MTESRDASVLTLAPRVIATLVGTMYATGFLVLTIYLAKFSQPDQS